MKQTSVQENVINERMKILGGNVMFKQMKKRVKNQKGLTLVELLAVIVILGIIAAIAVPAIGGIIDNSRDKAEISTALNILNGAKLAHTAGDCNADGGTGAVACDKTSLAGYVEGVPATTNYSVARNASTGVWTVTYTFNLKKTRGTIANGATSATEDAIKTALK